MKVITLRAKVLPSLMAGTSRHPLPEGLIHHSERTVDSGLELLSLMGQTLRFERPPSPESFVVEPEIKDERKIVADHLRRPLVRLLSAKIGTDHPSRALARAFDEFRLRPHPFDLPLIDGFVRVNAERLGPTAQHWADRQRPEAGAQSYFDPELLDVSNWTQAPPARRVAYLEQRRREKSDAARVLLESAWPQEEADLRFRLLQVLQSGLSKADEPFLQTLAKDRAPRVRSLAARFLARLGAGGENPALQACLERIKRKQGGLIRKRTVLELELPANVKEQTASRWILETFADVSFGELASALSLTQTELIDATAKDGPFLLALALIATNEHRFDLLEAVVAQLPAAWERMYESGLNSLGTMPRPDRQRWQEIVVRPYRKDLPQAYYLWDWLHRIIDAQADATVMALVLDGQLLQKLPERERGTAPWLEIMAAMCPASARPELRLQFTEFDSSQTVIPIALLDILDGMENDSAHV